MDDKPASRASPAAPPPAADPSALTQTQKLAELGMMTAAVLHELKQPLSGIKGQAQLLRERGSPVLEKADVILAQVDRIERLVAAHRRFLHVGGGTRSPQDLRTIAQQAAQLVEPRSRQAGVPVALKLPEQPLEVPVVEEQILQILVNLLCNAIDASAQAPRKSVELTVHADSGSAEVLVCDWGDGLSPMAAARLFTPFFTTKGAESGTGLGLYISRSLAEANGASLENVPAGAVQSAARTVFRLRFGAPAPVRANVQRQSVLVVDDEEVVCQLLTSLLEPEGVEVVVALNGEQAIKTLDQWRFDLVISDKNLPGATGLEIARAVKDRHPGCPVILMTGYPSLETAQEGLALGVMDYIEKPFDDIGEVRKRVREALKTRPGVVIELPSPQPAASPARRVLVVEDREADSVKIAEAVTLAGGVAVLASTVREALMHLANGGAAGVILSLDLRDPGLSPDNIRALRAGTGALVTLCDRPSLEQTVSAIRMGAAACLPRALASPQALARELSRTMALPPKPAG